jgi:hypothetical protein
MHIEQGDRIRGASGSRTECEFVAGAFDLGVDVCAFLVGAGAGLAGKLFGPFF